MIRAGLVGFGLGGRVFHAPLISSVEGLELSAVLERNTSNADERYPGITTYRTLDTMLADPALNLIVVSTPSGTHFDLARQVLIAGKNVVVDKPVAVTSAEVAELMRLAAKKNLLFVPFHERRWDGDFLTLQKLLSENSLGHLVHFETNYDRWRPVTRAAWKEDPLQGGGLLLDIGTHLVDQALTLFGKPQSMSAEVLHERPGNGSDDSFTLRLHYPDLSVTLSGNCLASLARPFYYLRGTKGNYWKWGLDMQESALTKITRIDSKTWGQEPAANWGTLSVEVDCSMVTRLVEPIPGDYRLYYAGVRDAFLGKSPAPVAPIDAWRVARLLEWAVESSTKRREIPCDWSGEPK